MKLTEELEIVYWPETHYVFVEKIGPFQENAPLAWAVLHKALPALAVKNQISGYFSLYKVELKLYRAGVSVAEAPAELPEGLAYGRFAGGMYSRLTYTGPYPGLGQATGRAWQIAGARVAIRDGFAIENYVNDPKTTPEEELITEILIPTE